LAKACLLVEKNSSNAIPYATGNMAALRIFARDAQRMNPNTSTGPILTIQGKRTVKLRESGRNGCARWNRTRSCQSARGSQMANGKTVTAAVANDNPASLQ